MADPSDDRASRRKSSSSTASAPASVKSGLSFSLNLTPTYLPSSGGRTSACSSAHPSPNGSITLEAATPRSMKQSISADVISPLNSRSTELTSSPFFADWQLQSPTPPDALDAELDSEHEEGTDAGPNSLAPHTTARRYSLTSTSAAASSVAALYASSSSPLFASPPSTIHDAGLARPSPTRPQEPHLQLQASDWQSPPHQLQDRFRDLHAASPAPPPLSPLPVSAEPPSAPRLGNMVTPVMTPRNSQPPPTLAYFRSLSPLLAHDAALLPRSPLTANPDTHLQEAPTIHALLDAHGHLPLPGHITDKLEPTIPDAQQASLRSPFGQTTTRSESVDSISSVINDCGGFDTVTSADAQAMAEASEPPMYGGSAVIHPMSAPPLQPLPSALDRALPNLPAKQVSDPPLISSLRRPDFLQVASDNTSSTSFSAAFDRPISPFSSAQAVFPEAVRRVGSSNQEPGYQSSSESPLATEQDLINFESDPESSPAPYSMLDSGEDLTYRLQPRAGDAIYFSQHHSQSRNLGDASDAESVSSNEADQEEEEDFEAHMLYSTLSKSQSPFVRKAWEGSKVVLVPPKYTLPSSFTADAHQYDASTSMTQPRDWERYTAAHALRQQAGSPDLFVGCGKTFGGKRLHAKLDAIKGQVEISLREEDEEELVPSLGLASVDEFGAPLVPKSQPLSRNAISMGGHASTSSSSTQAPPPNLMVSSASSIGSSNFPTTPPLSPESQQHAHTRSSSIAAVSSTRIPQGVAFPSVEPIFKYDKSPLSPTRRINIVREKPVYRRRRVSIANSSSAPSTLPSPPSLSRNETSTSISAVAGIPAANIQPQVNVQQLADRLSRLSTASMQSINSLASTQSGLKTVKKRDSKVRLRVPKWLGGRKDAGQPASSTMMITESAPSSPAVAQSKAHLAVTAAEEQLVIERVRVIKVDSYVIEWPGQEMLLSPRHDLRRSLPLSAAAFSQSHAARMYRKASQPLPVDRTLRETPLPEASALYRSESSVGCSEESGSIPLSQPSRLASRHNSNASRASRRSSNALRVKQILIAPSSQLVMRDFSSDIAYLLDPPASIEHFAGLFEQALKLIIRCCKDYAERFQYIRGLEQDAVRRLRTDILEQVWQYVAHEQSISVIHQHLFEIFENVIMAFSHDYVFARTIKPMFADHEAQFSQIVDVYRSHTVTMADFGISNSGYAEASFVPVLDILGELCGTGGGRRELWEKMTPQAYKRLVQLISQTTDSASTVIALLEAKTPVDSVAQLRKSIDELIRATSAGNVGGENRYGLVTDDLIPLLSWSVMKANAKGLPSLLFYARHFRLTDLSQAESNWTIVQFEAAIAYILTDPLQLWRNSASASPALDSAPMSPTAPILLRHNSDDSYTLSLRSRRTSVQSLPPESSRDKSRSPTSSTHRASHHKRTLSSVPSTRIVSYQASGRPSSVVSAVTTEENEDNAAMGPPAPPKRPGTSSSNGRNSIISSGSRAESEGTAAGPSQRLSDSHRQQMHRPTPVRPVSRAYHNSQDSTGLAASQPTRIPLGRSQTTPYSAVARPSSYLVHKASVDLHRTGSDPSRRASNGDWWGPLRYARGITPASPPPRSETTVSSRPESPASPALRTVEKQGSARSSFDLERSTSDIGWVEWGRRRLSSMTSSTSLVDSAEGGRSVADQIAEKIAASAARSVGAPPTKDRGRRNSESAAGSTSIPVQFEDSILETQAEQAPATLSEQLSRPVATQQRSLHRAGSRPRSTLSLSSTSSLDTESSLSRSVNASSSPMAGHSQFRTSISGLPSSYGSHSSNLSRSRRFRRELLSANLGPTMALPQLHLDTASASNASSLSSSICSAPTTGPSQRLSSLGPDNLPLSASSGGVSLAFPSSYSMSHSTSRLGTTPFSPIQEIAPGHLANSNSPDQLASTYVSAVPPEGIDSVPPTPTARAPGRTLA